MLPRVDLVRADENDWLLLKSPDHINNFVRENGYWGATDAGIAKVFLANRSNANVIDVGANIGGFTVPIARYLSATNGKLHAFEPQRIVFQQLCANIFLNRLDNVFTYNWALGDTNKGIKIPELDFWNSQNVGKFSVDEHIRSCLANEALVESLAVNMEIHTDATVDQRTLDSLNFEFPVNFIKVDIEGYELEFFEGSAHTIERNSFPPIIFEVWEKAWYAEKAEQTKSILASWGYDFHYFGREILAQHHLHSVQCNVTEKDGQAYLSVS